MHQVLLVTVLFYETSKRISRALIYQLVITSNERIMHLAEAYDGRRSKSVPCTQTILCERVGRRHKAGCIGRIEPVELFVKGVLG